MIRSVLWQLLTACLIIIPLLSPRAEQRPMCLKDQLLLTRRVGNPTQSMKRSEIPQKVAVKKWLKQTVLASPGDRPSTTIFSTKASRCPTVETVCRRFMRQARRGGATNLRKASHLTCEPNYQVRAFDTTPNDTYYSLQLGFNQGSDIDIDAPQAWDISQGSSSVVVGVIDTGIQTDHPDLMTNIWTNPGEIAGNGVDDDGNGYIDDVHGINAITNSGDLIDDDGHGTHCAGVIGGSGNNGVGIVGINWNVTLIGCKFLGSTGSGSTADAIQCVQYLTDLKTNHGINISVLSNSWGSTGNSSSLRTAFQAAANAGIISVAAAGNDASDNDGATKNYPASYPDDHIISVAAVDNDGTLASFSNFGVTSVDIGAPGVHIPSTGNNSTYIYLSGTSMATPHVAGALALLRANYPSFTVAQARDAVLQSSKPLSSLIGKVATGGMLNLYSMLLTAEVMASTTTTTTTTTTVTTTSTTTSTETTTSSTAVTSTTLASSTTTTIVETTTVPTITTTTTMRVSLVDSKPPKVRAQNVTGKANKSATINYSIDDGSGFTIDSIQIKKGTRVLQRYSLGILPVPSTKRRLVQTTTHRLSRGSYQYCVSASDPTGNQSAKSCATLKLK